MVAKQSTPFEPRYVLHWILINMVIGFSIPLAYDPEAFLSPTGWERIWDDILYSFLMSMGISGSVGLVERFLCDRYSWLNQPAKRLVLEFLGVTLLSFVAVFLINFFFFWAFGGFGRFGTFTLEEIPWIELVRHTRVPILIGYGITTFFVSRGFLLEWKQAAVDAEKLRSESYKGQVRFLREQLNPHFLFNSLNVLTNMVYEDADKAADYIRQLSRFYRYVLEVQNEEVVSLSREIDFTQRFFELQRSRFGNALQLHISLNGQKDQVIPPLVMQLLVENAIKHNSISEEQPMKIEILQEADKLVVRNNCNPKSQVEKSTGIGLANIKERYRILSDQEVEVVHDDKIFEVRLPLLELTENRRL